MTKTKILTYTMFGSLEGEESRVEEEESNGEKSREKWLSSTLFGCF